MPQLKYTYGKVVKPDGDFTHARRNNFTGEVQFILWRAGEQGHEKDYWHQFDKYWWRFFQSEEKQMSTHHPEGLIQTIKFLIMAFWYKVPWYIKWPLILIFLSMIIPPILYVGGAVWSWFESNF